MSDKIVKGLKGLFYTSSTVTVYFKVPKTNESIKLIGQVIENSERISSSLLWGNGNKWGADIE